MSKSTFALIASFFVLVGGILFAAAGTGSGKTLDEYAKIEIREGDTLWDLAETLKDKHGMSQTEFVEWVDKENNLSTIVIKPGDTVFIPVKKNELYQHETHIIASEE
ncbi:LysM peptidoglycan-binding domain-containing protein [Metabacillus sp. KIGAM252]|uniref:LysM peptidoglycan-binding domain-containing protein n=1 Tax=Metabacillus flavus TaxID=2823519 RepID=A0ABS5LF04_9BACI|nr:LysM peptidoglycan-binding domain-containing protein [Metabacillus flavus]MBS2969093.1 LysM peptidoglycan-binding domain-containing protein [Metabacillus flavus]